MPGFPSLSTAYQQKLLDHLFGKATLAQPANIFVALYTVAPTDAGGGTEVTVGQWNTYARKSTAPADWSTASAATPSVTQNVNPVAFTQMASGTGCTVVAFGLFDAVAGTYIGGGTCNLAVGVNVTPSFAAGVLTATLD